MKLRTTLEMFLEFKKYMANLQSFKSTWQIYKVSLYNSKSKHKHSHCNDCTTFHKYLIMNKTTKIHMLKFQILISISTVDLGLQKI